jgi:hypothetical protein
MVGLVSAHVQWNANPNLELQRSHNALQIELGLPSASTLSNICWNEYTMTVHTIRKQLPSRNNAGLALDRQTSTNKLAITLVMAYYMNQNWTLREVKLALDEVDSLLFLYFPSSILITGQWSTYWSWDRWTFEGSSGSFGAD